jgi:membrane protease YdiL (CAAX protease family)
MSENESIESPPVVSLLDDPASRPPPRKGWTKLSWVVILGVVAAIIGLRLMPRETGDDKKSAVLGRLDLKVLRWQLQTMVAVKQLKRDADPKEAFEQAEDLAAGDPEKALRVVAFAGEMLGPKEALKRLDALDKDANAELSPEQQRVRDMLRRLYQDQARGALDHPSVSDRDAQVLREHLGWFGELALFPRLPDPGQEGDAGLHPIMREELQPGRERVLSEATTTLFVLVGVAIGLNLLVMLGFLGLLVFLVLWLTGQVRVGLDRGIGPSGVYAETFAIWLVLYAGLLLVGELLLGAYLPALVRGSVAMPLSLVVLGWPALRGVPWAQVRHDIGWTPGRQPLLEPVCGIMCYVLNLPVVAIGFITTLLLATGYAAVQHALGGIEPGQGPTPTHPVIEELANPSWPELLLIFLVLSVIAPVVEETMFRGFLHRHLRDVMPGRHRLLGGLVTALVVNVIFAAVHPQGLLFIPVLTCMAMGFSLAREWRGTLIPSMCAHGLNNFLVGLLGVLILSR